MYKSMKITPDLDMREVIEANEGKGMAVHNVDDSKEELRRLKKKKTRKIKLRKPKDK